MDRHTRVEEQIEKLLYTMERMRFDDYIKYINDRPRLLWLNFMSGLARGFGAAVGFTILGAIVIVLLRNLVVDNIPLIGGFLAEVVRVVQERL